MSLPEEMQRVVQSVSGGIIDEMSGRFGRGQVRQCVFAYSAIGGENGLITD